MKYSLERAANDPAQTWTFTLTALKRGPSDDPEVPGPAEGISAPDDNTVVIELAQPWAPFLSDLAMLNCSIISEAFASGNEERLTAEMMGTGPFMQQEWKKGESITLAKNPTYWEEGLPFLDQGRINVVPDDNNRILQIQGGKLIHLRRAGEPAPRAAVGYQPQGDPVFPLDLYCLRHTQQSRSSIERCQREFGARPRD